ncbi:MAG: argininosuccinate lyase [Phycisphaeraceae bacterium]|nr:argininosuccinate lyase [Phycisphaerae bacterium]MBX3392483.1 argininosuccinate lyase [Phycisphaeraceae bacterium]
MAEATKQALWGGRFEGSSDPLFREFNDSLGFDHRLAIEDIAGSIAWAKAIHRAGVLADDELAVLLAALARLAVECQADPRAPLGSGEEDIHSWVESRLVARAGAVGKKLHTGRSRNDQVATDLRLWTRGAIDRRREELTRLRCSLVALAGRHREAVIPGYTHLQRAQPVLFAHWCLAYESMFARDDGRLADARVRLNRCPLGSGALAGTAYPIDRAVLAADLGFDGPTDNSLDAVSDRDFVIETIGALAVVGVHLSRLAEDMILYCSQEFGFVELSDAVSSGSSLMPQKKNPDSLELIRGKCGRLAGAHVAMLTAVKGLPLAYNKDMQEDKEPLFDAMQTASLCVRMAAVVLDHATLRAERSERAALGGYANATELADYLVRLGVPFRESHDMAGRAVRHAIGSGKPLEALSIEELRSFCPLAGPDVFESLSLESCLARREILGGTGRESVGRALDEAVRRLGLDRVRSSDAPV